MKTLLVFSSVFFFLAACWLVVEVFLYHRWAKKMKKRWLLAKAEWEMRYNVTNYYWVPFCKGQVDLIECAGARTHTGSVCEVVQNSVAFYVGVVDLRSQGLALFMGETPGSAKPFATEMLRIVALDNVERKTYG